jgi:NAD(P) transhydrogenase
MADAHPPFDFDLIVIGAGPGGEGAAMEASKRGLRVAVVDRLPRIGGACTHLGTIPSKSLRHAIFRYTEFKADELFRKAGLEIDVQLGDLRRSAEAVIARQVEMRSGFYDRNDITVLQGEASFVDANTLAVADAEGETSSQTAAHFIIATGSRPYRPPDVDFSHPRIFDSDTILTLDRTPRTMTIYGAGVVGCEYASMFRNLGVQLNLVNTRDQLLEFLDDEIIDALAYHMRDLGIRIRHRETCLSIEARKDAVVLNLESGKSLRSDILLWANGRTGNTDTLALERIGLEVDRRGQIAVNESLQTAVPNIYAAGDVTGPPALASAAYVEGRFAARQIATGAQETFRSDDIPTGIYTSPEISSLGRTERELTDARVPYEVGHSMFKNLAKAQIDGRPVGMLKLLFHRETLALLGVHCFGTNASEIIHIGQAILTQPPPSNSITYFVDKTFNYPTMAEAYRVAALNGLNRL